MHARRFPESGGEGKGFQVRRVIGPELLARPEGGGPGHGIEPVEVYQAERAVLVISRDHPRHALAQKLDARVWVRAVTHGIAQADEPGRAFPRGIGEDGGQSFEISVHVREHRVAHAGLSRRDAALCGCGPGRR